MTDRKEYSYCDVEIAKRDLNEWEDIKSMAENLDPLANKISDELDKLPSTGASIMSFNGVKEYSYSIKKSSKNIIKMAEIAIRRCHDVIDKKN